MKLALYLPNFRNHVTVQELADLTDLDHAIGVQLTLSARLRSW